MRAGSVVVIIPTLNEQDSVAEVVSTIPRPPVDRIIVADGPSSDATGTRAAHAGAEVIKVGRGYGRACATAVEAAADAEIIVFMDGDGADDPGRIPDLIAPIRAGTHDFVIGSRVRGERETGSMAWHQVTAGLFAGALLRVLYGVRYTDMCAFRAIRREQLLRLKMREMTYGWNIEMQIRAARARLRVLEVPVSYRRRLGGRSKVAGNFRGSARASIQIMGTLIRVLVAGKSRSKA